MAAYLPSQLPQAVDKLICIFLQAFTDNYACNNTADIIAQSAMSEQLECLTNSAAAVKGNSQHAQQLLACMCCSHACHAYVA